MIGAEREHKVTICSETCSVTTYQKSKTVWIAVGTYMGETREAKGTSAGSALSSWKVWATTKGG
ncbi:hypothetical protein ACVIWU_006732 [Bradyrhizobium sp. USDA 4509]